MTNSHGSKTHEIVWIPIGEIADAWWNPNYELPEKFNALYESILDIGMVETVQVIPISYETQDKFDNPADKSHFQRLEKEGYKYLVVHGSHRFQAAKTAGIDAVTEVPAVVLDIESGSKIKALSVRMNIIRGQIDAEKFTALYEELVKDAQFSQADVWNMLGVISAKELDSMLKKAKALATEIESGLQTTKNELENMEMIRRMLHDMIARFGQDLEHQFMSFVIGNKSSSAIHTYIRLSRSASTMLATIKEFCREKDVDINDVLVHGWRAALGADEIEWPESKDSDLGIEE